MFPHETNKQTKTLALEIQDKFEVNHDTNEKKTTTTTTYRVNKEVKYAEKISEELTKKGQ